MASALPPLSTIRVFEAAARHLNFTAAGEELAMTQAAVSYQIRLLEEWAETRLFTRQARGVELTEAGARLAPFTARALAELREGFATLKESQEEILSISAVATFATTWLVPRLGFFQLAHPQIAVRLETTNRAVDFPREAIDLGIRAGHGNWPGLAQHKLRDMVFAPMLSPSLAARLGPDPSPADLLKLPLIEPVDPWWQDWFAAAGIDAGDLAEKPGLQLLTQYLAARAAMAGQGVAILEPAFFAEEIASGRLVQPFALTASSGWSYFLVYPQTPPPPRKVRLFEAWLKERLSEEAKTARLNAAAPAIPGG
ncbi:LysR substrate-binding domain-containing protein [Afifella pfennigii]|uniref:LysR substrate-binding domain-containing protein n=1 Tax=Afifella pfennigii TaxID=209897 RepID=UPI00068E9F2D|nr:LysR substrate-binding domain-containing protein [Afifella pfennigii]